MSERAQVQGGFSFSSRNLPAEEQERELDRIVETHAGLGRKALYERIDATKNYLIAREECREFDKREEYKKYKK